MIEGFAVDLGGTKTAAARIVDGRVEDRVQTPTDRNASFDGQMESIAMLLRQLGYHGNGRLGVAVAGRVDSDGCWQAVNPNTLTGIDGKPLRGWMQERYGGIITVRNDAAAATLAEARLGAGIGADHFAYLTVSTGIGGGISLNGRLLESRNGLAGHVGFVSSPYAVRRCGSGRIGTVESVASGHAIALAGEVRTAREAFEADTPQAKAAINRSAAAIARLCADLTSLFGLDRIAIGGSIGLAEGYLPQVEHHLRKEPQLFQVNLTPAMLGHDSVLLGALMTAD
ncbi:ROK family protein [Nitratireductor pacificus]|uniref:N-acetylmannosamine kinase n=1 Tax=Nitratireductor pacificus pht-3B TaxID=391937 RepID=K2LRU3_9HYPH|nr:ROK family protein [Nitratireductor pacificus]EKF20504.1 N-acetylmannosamine kinase [Nitratireductor pacificus pht-3B]